MKYKMILKVLLVGLLAQFARLQTMAQLNCDGITNMYGIFIDLARGNGNTYVAPINYATGIAGTALAPGVFTIPRAGTSGGDNAYGSTTLAVEGPTNRVFMLTGDYNSKDIWGFTSTPATLTKVADTMGTAVNGHWFVKLAMAQDGYAYSLSTKRVSPISTLPSSDTRLIRFNSCMTSNCAATKVMGIIPYASFNPFQLYNGDIAFDSRGDMYIFGSEFDGVNNDYVRAGIFRINKADIPTTPGSGNVPITRLGDIPAMDSLSITGVAFDGAGNFYLSAMDTITGQKNRSHIYRGSIISASTAVTQIWIGVVPNYFLGDLASCTFPNILLVDAASAKLNGFNRGSSNALVWKVEGINNLKNFVVERQLDGEPDFKSITTVTASSSISEYNYSDDMKQFAAVTCNYRIKFEKKDGSVTYSNTIQLQVNDQARTKVLVTGNPFKQTLQFDLTTLAPGFKNILVYDNNGFVVLREKIAVVAGMNKVILDKTSSFKKGIYILQVYDESNSQQIKVVKN